MEWIKITPELDLISLLDKDLLFMVNKTCCRGSIENDEESKNYLTFCDQIDSAEYYNEPNYGFYKKEEVSHYYIIELPE